MYEEGDLIEINNLEEDVKEDLCKALKAEFDQIQFYFVEYDKDDYVTLSAETDTMFAIVKCPLSSISGSEQSEFVSEMEDFCRSLLINGCLDRWNEAQREGREAEPWNKELFYKAAMLDTAPKDINFTVFEGDE